MRVTILVDNNTLTDRYFLAEPGLCLLLEHEGQRTLLDAGYSDVFLTNAAKMGHDLLHLERVVLSHGHLDHCWGLWHLMVRRNEAEFEGLLPESARRSPPELVAHPEALQGKHLLEGNSRFEIGSVLPPALLESHFSLRLSQGPLWLSDKLLFLGEVPRRFDFENAPPVGMAERKGFGGAQEDRLPDDTALVWMSDGGIVVFTGCSHSGICNIAAYALELTGADRVLDVVGGLHLLDASPEKLEATSAYLSSLGLEALHACHCTDLAARIALAARLPLKETGVGLILDYD